MPGSLNFPHKRTGLTRGPVEPTLATLALFLWLGPLYTRSVPFHISPCLSDASAFSPRLLAPEARTRSLRLMVGRPTPVLGARLQAWAACQDMPAGATREFALLRGSTSQGPVGEGPSGTRAERNTLESPHWEAFHVSLFFDVSVRLNPDNWGINPVLLKGFLSSESQHPLGRCRREGCPGQERQ